QSNKAAPKKNKKNEPAAKTKAPTKAKNAPTVGATPADSAEPPTPTPSTPITPMHASSFNQKNGSSAPNAQQPAAQAQGNAGANAPAQPPQMGPQGSQMDPSQQPFGDLGADNFGGIGDFADPANSSDVLENFDFDSFLHTDGGNDFSLDFGSMNFDVADMGQIEGS
ncbi:hypothetical protein LTS18_014261, partial [Coniosporium uncinatum]